MKVVLLTHIRGLGRAGDIKDVNDGHARNYLIPRKLAKAASTGSLKESLTVRTQKLQTSQLAHEEALRIRDVLSHSTVTLSGRANAKGTLFSSISKADIAKKLSEIAGAHIEQDAIIADDQLKTVGTHSLSIKIHDNVTANCTLVIEHLS